MLKFGTISALFAIFKNFTSFMRSIWTASAWNHIVKLLEKWYSCPWDISKTMYTKWS
jgi:hypothetical protein